MKKVKVIVDRPAGYRDSFGNVYPINYGYVENVFAGDGEEQDVYILGETEPLEFYEGFLIAYVKRKDDVEDKWVAAGRLYSAEEISRQIAFMEQYFDSHVELCGDDGKA